MNSDIHSHTLSPEKCLHMMKFQSFIMLFFLLSSLLPAQNVTPTVIESTQDYIVVKLDFSNVFHVQDTTIDGRVYQKIEPDFLSIRKTGEPWLPECFFSLGVPLNSSPVYEIVSAKETVYHNKFILPYPDTRDTIFQFSAKSLDKSVYSRNQFFPSSVIRLEPVSIMRYAGIMTIGLSPYQFNPVTKELKLTAELTCKISYSDKALKSLALSISPVTDKATDNFLRNNVVNYQVAKNWTGKVKRLNKTNSGDYWYSPDKNFYKLFLNTKGVYRVTFEELKSAGVSIPSGLSSKSLEIFSQGESIPLDVYDNGDGTFDSGDYFQFLGTPAPASPFVKQNIYNTENVFWFTYQGSYADAKRYTETLLPAGIVDTSISFVPRTDFYERDSVFEHLGESPTVECDYWFWGITTANDGKTLYSFSTTVNNFYKPVSLNSNISYRVNLQGITNTYCNYDHHALVYLNGKQIGSFFWDGQTDSTFTGSFNPQKDSITLSPSGNIFQVTADGNVCSEYKVDDIRINWFDFTYNSTLDASGTSLTLKANPSSKGVNTYKILHWTGSDISIYSPSTGQKFKGVFQNDTSKTVVFSDSITINKDYYALSNASFLKVDSIRVKSPSYLHKAGNGADYIIIKHDKFTSIAQRLKTLREKSFPDSDITAPRVYIADVQDIYDEFSYGILDPYALKYFVEYAFQNWTAPAPLYVTLIGDMSHDYRHLLKSSRINYIPSIPYHSYEFGFSGSDNAIAAVSGDDIVPDVAIGRLSIEEISEGNIILDKLENYPSDNTKQWKQTVALFSAGVNSTDAATLGFNAANLYLESAFVKPASMRTKNVFRYPTNTNESQFQGGVVEMRDAINSGAVLLNYYGHGASSQWDLTFYSDDIYLLENEGRLPVILNPTCFTANYDDQDIFGEQFLKIPNKGCIGFVGCSGMTHWEAGRIINEEIFNEIFTNKNFVSGRAFQNAKAVSPQTGYYADQISLLTYLGDPALQLAFPKQTDYAIHENDISTASSTLLTNEETRIKIKLNNFGILSKDSVTIKLEFQGADSSGVIGIRKIAGFALDDSLSFSWTPVKGSDYTLTARINFDKSIAESDYTNNSASILVTIFDLSEPNCVEPLNGQYQQSNVVRFTFADVTSSQSSAMTYYVEVDTAITFLQPVVKSVGLTGKNGVLTWNCPTLPKGKYFWHSRIFDGNNYGAWSAIKSFCIGDSSFTGTKLANEQLRLFACQNLNYDASNKVLTLNKNLLPPMPSAKKLITDIHVADSSAFSQSRMSLCATDGKYFYLADEETNAALINHDTTGRTPIYKVGTGMQGTSAGVSYSSVNGFNRAISGQYCIGKNGVLYAPTQKPLKIMNINPASGVVDTLTLANGLLDKASGLSQEGNFLLASDSNYVYNLAYMNSAGNPFYTMRIFQPDNSWQLIKNYSFPGVKALTNVTGFFVSNNYFYVYGEESNGTMQRVNMTDTSDTLSWQILPSNYSVNGQWYYNWTYDYFNNFVYATQHRPGIELSPIISKFTGKYSDPSGLATSPVIGPAASWREAKFGNSKSGTTGTFLNAVLGYNKSTKAWDTLRTTSSSTCNLSDVAPSSYQYIKTVSMLIDSTYDKSTSQELQFVSVQYSPSPELMTSSSYISLAADTVIQTTNADISATIRNISRANADTVNVSVKVDGKDVTTVTQSVPVPADSSATVKIAIPTSGLSALTLHTVKITAAVPNDDMYSFNNSASKSFYVTKDTVRPILDVTFDGKHIVDGDIVKPASTVVMSLSDNISTRIDSTNFLILFDNKILSYSDKDISFNYSAGTKASTVITWRANFSAGSHVLKIQAKDANGNYSGADSTFLKFEFTVYTENDVANIYPYPNPFSENTCFTFQLRGEDKPENVSIKIYTIAGRLIRSITTDGSGFDLNFNKIFWDGRDSDGDRIANGVYLYKVIVKFKDKTVSSVNKMAKVSN
jgi:hypothetical protein